MSRLTDIFDALTDEQLKAVVRDLQCQDETGILPGGPARELQRRISIEVGIPEKDAFQLVQHEPLRRAAFKWAQYKTPKKDSDMDAESEIVKLRIRGSGGVVWVVPAAVISTNFKRHTFAVHKAIDIESTGWTVSHVATGFAVEHGVDRKSAVDAAIARLKTVKASQFDGLVEKALAQIKPSTIGELLNSGSGV